jgi:hypothetical protein
MGSFFDNAPAIIEAASRRPLGIVALIIMAFSFLAYLFFRKFLSTVTEGEPVVESRSERRGAKLRSTVARWWPCWCPSSCPSTS